MRVETNTVLVQRNRRIAQWLFYFSLGVLALALFVNFSTLQSTQQDPLLFVLPTIILPIGLVATLISVRMTNLWLRLPRPEIAIRDGLKGISNKSVLYNYYHAPARHILFCPQGVFAIVTRFQSGVFAVNGDKWTSRRNPLSRLVGLFRLDGLGNPTRDAQEAAVHVQKVLDAAAPGIKVQPLVVFIEPRVQLEITDPIVPVLHADDDLEPNLTDYLRDLNKASGGKPAIPPAQLPQIVAAFEAATLPKAKTA